MALFAFCDECKNVWLFRTEKCMYVVEMMEIPPIVRYDLLSNNLTYQPDHFVANKQRISLNH